MACPKEQATPLRRKNSSSRTLTAQCHADSAGLRGAINAPTQAKEQGLILDALARARHDVQDVD